MHESTNGENGHRAHNVAARAAVSPHAQQAVNHDSLGSAEDLHATKGVWE